ncbi:hypothetical protein TI05_05350 [Achromatium sp. WMS3]|nr:hypothetical protein TI05_05350 [Achromatium sp. WMS3]
MQNLHDDLPIVDQSFQLEIGLPIRFVGLWGLSIDLICLWQRSCLNLDNHGRLSNVYMMGMHVL